MIHIIQQDEESKIIESTIIDVNDVCEIHCVYNLKEKTEEESTTEEQPLRIDTTEELEILYKNGERRNISITMPTMYRLIYGDEIMETTVLQKFESLYIGMMSAGIEEDDE